LISSDAQKNNNELMKAVEIFRLKITFSQNRLEALLKEVKNVI